MAELTRDIATYLIAQGQATAVGTDVFLDTRPDTPDNAVCVFEYAGEPSTIQDDLSRRVQILVRNKSYATGRAKAWDIHAALDKPEARTLTMNGRRAWVRALQPPFKLETDDKGRAVFVFNLEVRTSRD
jgi:hypothetical protein